MPWFAHHVYHRNLISRVQSTSSDAIRNWNDLTKQKANIKTILHRGNISDCVIDEVQFNVNKCFALSQNAHCAWILNISDTNFSHFWSILTPNVTDTCTYFTHRQQIPHTQQLETSRVHLTMLKWKPCNTIFFSLVQSIFAYSNNKTS